MGRKMKDSGVEWIGAIPEEWDIERLKYQFDFGKGLAITKADLVEDGIGVISYGQIHAKSNMGTALNDSLIRYIPKDSEAITKSSLLHKGDFVFADTSEDLDGCGNCVYIDEEKEIYAGYHTIILRNKKSNGKYLAYLFQTDNWRKQIRSKVSGVKVFSISKKILSEAINIIPPIEMQNKIVELLDAKCSAIDVAIEKANDSIVAYKSLKQSLITRVVTKGVRGRREMKESGIEWIGHCPSDWELRPFRYILKERQEKNSPIKSKERLSLSIDLGVTLYAEKTTNLDRFKDDFEQYKLAYPGDLVMNSMNMIVGASGVSDYFGCVSPVYYTFYDDTDNHVTAKFCEYIFRSRAMMRVLFSMGKGIYAIVRGDDRVNTCRLKVSKEDLKSLKLPLPSLDEQQEIVTYLDEKLSDIDTLIVKKEQLVSELENYKKSLIYEYVTGKREVLA